MVPALSRWSGTVVGLTLMAIGLMGIYETYFAGPDAEEHEEQELKLAMAGARARWWVAGQGGWVCGWAGVVCSAGHRAVWCALLFADWWMGRVVGSSGQLSLWDWSTALV